MCILSPCCTMWIPRKDSLQVVGFGYNKPLFQDVFEVCYQVVVSGADCKVVNVGAKDYFLSILQFVWSQNLVFLWCCCVLLLLLLLLLLLAVWWGCYNTHTGTKNENKMGNFFVPPCFQRRRKIAKLLNWK